MVFEITFKDGSKRMFDTLVGADLRNANLIDANLTSTKGVIASYLGKHLAFGYVFENQKYVKIGCRTETIVEWLQTYESVGKSENYNDVEVKKYGYFLKMLDDLMLEDF